MLDGGEDILTGEIVPGGGDDDGIGVQIAKHSNALLDLVSLRALGMREDYGRGVRDLVAVKFAEVLQVHLALIHIGNGGEAVELCTVLLCGASRANDVGELSYSRGLDDDSVGLELVDDLLECLREIAHERAADTARVHLGDLDARIGEEAAVDADLTEFVLDEHELFALIRLGNKLFYKCSLSGAEEAGEYINFRHFFTPFDK